jgi:hypothetical protein
MIETTSPPSTDSQFAKKVWISPYIHMLDINAAEGAAAGPLCDKFGSLSATSSHDYCDAATK